MNKEFKKGTTTVGIICKEGIVLAADKRVSMGTFISSKKIDKIFKITKNMALTTAGLVSDAQLLVKLAKAQLNLNKLRTAKEAKVKEAANLLSAMLYQNIRKLSPIPSIVSFILGGKDITGFQLYELGIDGSITKADDYRATGSGSILAYGFLENSYNKNMSINETIQLSIKTINTAIQRDSATGDGIDIVTITKQGVKKILSKKITIKI